MSVEETKKFAEQIGTLGSCLIEGDSEQKARERKVKRRALIISTTLQSLAIVALVLVPLLGHTEKLAFTIVTPMPPYYHHPAKPVVEHTSLRPPAKPTGFYAPTNISPTIVTHDDARANNDSIDPGTIDIGPQTPGDRNGLIAIDDRRGPAQPEDPSRNQKRRIVVGGTVQQAMLLHRVEPLYPPLARQLRRSGQVHLRAIISTEGAIESLQVMDGDPLLVQSALDAVGQWHYQPTRLNGQPVEVETIITVVYHLSQ